MEFKPILQKFPPPRRPLQIKRWFNGLLLRSSNWLGDLLMTLPAAYQMRRQLPEGCGLFVLSPAPLAELWRACPWVDVVMPMAQKRVSFEESRQVRCLCPGVAVALPNSFGSAWDIWRCGVPLRIGRGGRLRSLLLTHTLPTWPRPQGRATRHQLSYYLDLAAALGEVEFEAYCPPLQISPEAAEKSGIRRAAGWLALAPGAAFGPAKQWPVANFAFLAQKWHQRGGRVVLLGASREIAAAEEISRSCPAALNLAGQTNLGELMSILANVDLLVANDSGAMHLAAALGTSGVAIFGSTDPIATGPLGARWRILASEEECSPCFQRICPRGEADQPYACLRGIRPEAVLAEIQQLQQPAPQ